VAAASIPSYLHTFQTSIEGVALPDQLAYPFYYVPHPLAVIASHELQDYLRTQSDWEHDFGFDSLADSEVIGKMFGVLVVKTNAGELGYLCAVSGKLAGHNQHTKFVPPVFDILVEDGFFRRGEALITDINNHIAELEEADEYKKAFHDWNAAKIKSEEELETIKRRNRYSKTLRDNMRLDALQTMTSQQMDALSSELNKQSIQENYELKDLTRQWKWKIETLHGRYQELKEKIDVLKLERKQRSAALQKEIFEQYFFLNARNEKRSVGALFEQINDGKPIAGTGECAAPKLFQYAFLNELTPVALAEFWWGASPKTEVRKHEQFYPACRGKCEPILGFMLQGLKVEANPMLRNPAEGRDLNLAWEDEHLVIVNKPHEFLSVPGKQIDDSVYTRLRQQYPEADGPLIVHRLDMSTSGVMIVAKTEDVYKILQSQFMERVVKKRYVAWLAGEVQEDQGWIELPLRVDLDDRPRQIVCSTYGKPAKTFWKVVERKPGLTKVHFYPITGRTHQLRVHAAHRDGLNCPIVGDDLYGTRADRLYLHADWIQFIHPATGRPFTYSIEAPF
jgi:tRNA pseudouridine32 synthase / 23S rRNA pseudouridine746 synthase